MVQYSDTPRLEIPLGSHHSGAEFIQAMQRIDYLGGNTQVKQQGASFAAKSVLTESSKRVCTPGDDVDTALK